MRARRICISRGLFSKQQGKPVKASSTQRGAKIEIADKAGQAEQQGGDDEFAGHKAENANGKTQSDKDISVKILRFVHVAP